MLFTQVQIEAADLAALITLMGNSPNPLYAQFLDGTGQWMAVYEAYADPDGNKGSGNPNGHIIRFRETGDASTATTFRWDIFAFGSEEDADPASVNVSRLTAGNSFSSPDGLWFSRATGILWIETDDGAFTDETNCMLLAAAPFTL